MKVNAGWMLLPAPVATNIIVEGVTVRDVDTRDIKGSGGKVLCNTLLWRRSNGQEMIFSQVVNRKPNGGVHEAHSLDVVFAAAIGKAPAHDIAHKRVWLVAILLKVLQQDSVRVKGREVHGLANHIAPALAPAVLGRVQHGPDGADKPGHKLPARLEPQQHAGYVASKGSEMCVEVCCCQLSPGEEDVPGALGAVERVGSNQGDQDVHERLCADLAFAHVQEVEIKGPHGGAGALQDHEGLLPPPSIVHGLEMVVVPFKGGSRAQCQVCNVFVGELHGHCGSQRVWELCQAQLKCADFLLLATAAWLVAIGIWATAVLFAVAVVVAGVGTVALLLLLLLLFIVAVLILLIGSRWGILFFGLTAFGICIHPCTCV